MTPSELTSHSYLCNLTTICSISITATLLGDILNLSFPPHPHYTDDELRRIARRPRRAMLIADQWRALELL
jgi:hypothetical protein